MANAMTAPIPMQPELRALMVYDHLPSGCVSFLCADEYSMPHIRPGEFVVVDTNDRAPRKGEVYVIEWSNGRRNICQARISAFISAGERWDVGSLRTIKGCRSLAQWIDQAMEFNRRTGQIAVLPSWSDGPLPTDALQHKLVGCVIGLYAPMFEEPKRVAGGVS